MKCSVPEISWHNRDPVLSVDFQKNNGTLRRLATCGTDSHIVIWYVTLENNGHISLEFAADLNRHTKPVNVVRFSPNGENLASGDDESAIVLWKLQDKGIPDISDLIPETEDKVENKENWVALKVLRGHIDDVCDLCWSPDSNFLLSGSVDNTAILWDIQKGKNIGILSEHKGFVQGVAWDPKNNYVATLGSDRSLRIYNIQTKRVLYKVEKAVLPAKDGQEAPIKPVRIYYDDTLKSYCRRLAFSPDGELLFTPSGIIEQENGDILNSTYAFSRTALNKPVIHYPTGDKYTVAVSCCPKLFELEKIPVENKENFDNLKPWEEVQTVFKLPYRMVFAVATSDSILLYDTQQQVPIAYVTNIHYTRLTDLAWSQDGRILIASSTDGYCSFITFDEEELGTPYKPKVIETESAKNFTEEIKMDVDVPEVKLKIEPKEVPETTNKPAPKESKPNPVSKPGRRVAFVTLKQSLK